MKFIASLVEMLLETLVCLVTIAAVLIFGLCAYSNYEEAKNDWRNYELQLNTENGVSVDYKAPISDIMENSVDDFLEVVEGAINQ